MHQDSRKGLSSYLGLPVAVRSVQFRCENISRTNYAHLAPQRTARVISSCLNLHNQKLQYDLDSIWRRPGGQQWLQSYTTATSLANHSGGILRFGTPPRADTNSQHETISTKPSQTQADAAVDIDNTPTESPTQVENGLIGTHDLYSDCR